MKNTLAKKLAAAAIACAMVASPAVALAQAPSQPTRVAIVAQDEDYDHALRVALDHAGVPRDMARNISIYYRRLWDNTLVYNVEFETPDHFYGYQINAKTFEVHDSYVN